MKVWWVLFESRILIQINNPVPGIEPLTLGLQGQCFTSTPRGLTERDYCFSNSKHVNYIYLYQALYLWNHWNGPPPLEKPPALIFHLLSALFPYASPTSLNSFCPKWFLQSRKYCGLWAICLKTWLFIIFCWLLVQKYLKKETWALNFPKEWAPPVNYGSTGCENFKQVIQNWEDFCLRINIRKRNYWILSFGLTASCQKVPRFDFSNSIFYVKNHRNLSQFFIEEYQFRSTFFVIDTLIKSIFKSISLFKMMPYFWQLAINPKLRIW